MRYNKCSLPSKMANIKKGESIVIFNTKQSTIESHFIRSKALTGYVFKYRKVKVIDGNTLLNGIIIERE